MMIADRNDSMPLATQALGAPSEMIQDLWLDRENADALIEQADVSPLAKQIARELRSTGLAIIKGAHSPDLCRAVIEDYQRFAEERADLVDKNRDSLGREKRLVNFHLWSKNAEAIVTNRALLEALDFAFGMRTSVYTSLTFKYGTQQPVHRDTPHFSTWPASYFVGMWTALEEVHQDAGALFFHPGAHKFELDHHKLLQVARDAEPNASPERLAALALDLYNGEVIRKAPSVSEPVHLNVSVGDTVIWHPQMPHGGSIASDPMRTRWSIVAHCAPEKIGVNQHLAFFHHNEETQPAHWYEFRDSSSGRKIALSGETNFM